MGIAEDAFRGLWPEKEIRHEFFLKYSGKFKGYNANIRMSGSKITFSMSRNWRGISSDIKMGLMQELLARIFKEKKSTQNIDLYHIFIQKVHIAVPKTKSEPEIEQSFDRVNSLFFAGMLEKPNFKWNSGKSRLGSYDYGSDTITINTSLKGEPSELMDYVMYHEMLHKKNKFSSKNGKLRYHTREFREMEKSFPNSNEIEQKLRHVGRRAKKQASPLRRFPFFRIF